MANPDVPFRIRAVWDRGEETRELPDVGIPNGQFKGASDLKSVYIDAITVGEAAFANCTTLVSVTFTARLRYIGHEAFAGCTGLKSVTFENPPSWDGWFGIYSQPLFFGVWTDDEGNRVARDADYPVSGGCFKDCTGLESFEFPGSTYKFSWGTFEGCTSLKTVTIWRDTADSFKRKDTDWSNVLRGTNVNTINVLRLVDRQGNHPGRARSPMPQRTKEIIKHNFFNVRERGYPKGGTFTTTIRGKVKVLPKLMEVRYFFVDFEGNRFPAKTPDGEPVVFRHEPRLRRWARELQAEQLARANGSHTGWRDTTRWGDESRDDSLLEGFPQLPREVWGNILQQAATNGALHDWTAAPRESFYSE
jgi:hypothetical protein